MQKRLFSLLACLFLFLGGVFAQTDISGTVISQDDKQPIIGASVIVEGTRSGTITDAQGRFTLQVPKGKRITITYIGMQRQTLQPKPGMRVELVPDDKTLGEVVVTGVQQMDKRTFTGATTKIDADKAKLDGVADISRSLEGRVAGVSVQNVSGTFGTAPKIRVRGATSIYGSSKPLWVVDGVIMEDVTSVDADQLSSGDAKTLISSAIAGLNSDDIESFQILKDGSATSIYGARAMSGVIVVTTKKGHAGQNHISYTGEYTMRLKPSYNQFNIMNSQEQMGIYKELYNDGWLSFSSLLNSSDSGVYGKMYQLMNTYDPATGKFALANTDQAMKEYLRQAEYRNTNWFNELFSNSISRNHSISMSTGTDKAQYYASFSFMNDPGWTLQSKVKRFTANINANYNLSKELSLNMIGNASYRKQRAPGTTNQNINIVTGAVSRDFDINPYSYAINTSRALDPNIFYTRNYAPFNIKNELANNFMDLDVIDLKYQAQLTYKPIMQVQLQGLIDYKFAQTVDATRVTEHSNMAQTYRAMDNATIRDANRWLYTDPDVPNSLPNSVLPNGGFYSEQKYKMNGWDARFTANYNDAFGREKEHIVNLFYGMEVNTTNRFSSYFDGVGTQYDMGLLGNYDYHYFKQASEQNDIYYYLGNGYERKASFYGYINYSYKHRYNLNFTERYEGSNRLGKSTSARWLPTWNVSGSWNAHEEPWFDKTFKGALSTLTLRASYSLTGQDPASTNAAPIIESYNPYRPFANDKESGLYVYDFANPDLTYEKKHELNVGLDAGFLNDRISLTFDLWTRKNFDLIGPKRTTGVGGSITKYANVADMSSHGEELSISTKNILNKNFQWSTDFIFSHYKTKVTSLDTDTRIIDLITGNGFTMVGYPHRALFSLDFRGLNNKGLPTFINQDGNVTVDDINFQTQVKDHLVYEGPTEPTITGSLGNTFTYKNWHLIVFATYSFGNKIRLDQAFWAWYSDLNAMPKEFKNRWTKAGDEKRTDIPVIADLRIYDNSSRLSYAYNAYNLSTARVAKGDFIRMKEISLAYDFPQKWVHAIRLSSLSMKLQATNLFLLYADKKLNGQDPEFFNAGGVAVPMARQLTFTLKLGL